ncbi:MAG TPA: hypothetical protein VMV49_03680 [Candidatus Deferrimicrobium sp.]|nr:hypothetical protein [Candidatus Deferrimicrobium sp.]
MSTQLFLTEKELAPWGLRLTQDNLAQGMRIWTTENMQGIVQRVVDIRWRFVNALEAIEYHKEHLTENSEAAQEIQIADLESFGQDLRIFQRGAEDPMLATLGLKLQMFYFLFHENNIVAKVFVSGSGDLKLQDAIKIAKAAEDIIKKALN